MPLDSRSRRSEAQGAEHARTLIRTVLEEARERLHAEIGAYPSPIPACDEHFNHLLAQRARIARALELLRTDGSPTSLADCRRLLDEIDEAPSPISEEARARLRSCLREE